MYQEDWDAFERTIRGVQQSLIDLYNDEIDATPAGQEPRKWNDFINDYLVVLIADGYMNIGARSSETDSNNFKKNAIAKGFFKPDHLKDIFTKEDKNDPKKRNVLSIQELIEKGVKIKSETGKWSFTKSHS
jgi:hypothetical protein